MHEDSKEPDHVRDLRELQEFAANGTSDQLYSTIRDTLPRLWWNLFEGAKEAGFTTDQAFEIVLTYISRPAT